MKKRRRSYKKPWADRYLPSVCLWVVLFSIVYFIFTFPWLEVGETDISLARFFNLRSELEEKYPEIKDLKIKYRWPNEIAVSWVKREPVLSVCFPECFLVDDEGIVFARGEYIPRLHVSSHKPALRHKIPWSLPIFYILDYNGFTDIILDNYLEAKHIDGWTAYFNWEDLDRQINELDIIWQQMDLDKSEVEYIDLRFEKAFLKRN